MERNMDAIRKLLEKTNQIYDKIWERANIFELRRRLNTHHPPEVIEEETRLYTAEQQQDMEEMMSLFSENRNAFSELTELTEHQKAMLETLEKVASDQLEKELGL